MDTIIEAIRQEQIRLITTHDNIDIAIYHRLMDYLQEAERHLQLYIREIGR